MSEWQETTAVSEDDRQLLARYVHNQDQAAFSLLVARHGQMAQGVCRRILGASTEADDAYQATLLILIDRARELLRSGTARSIGGWLHRVASNASLQILRESKSRRRREARFASSRAELSGDDPMLETLSILDEELRKLPDRYRNPLVLCYLEDQTRQEAADALGLSHATLRRRIDQGRELLRSRLVRRGCLIAPALLLALLEGAKAHAESLGPDTSLVLSKSLKRAEAPGVGSTGLGVSSRSIRISREVVKSMRAQMLRKMAGLLALPALVASVALVAQKVEADDPKAPAPDQKTSKPAPSTKPGAKGTKPAPASTDTKKSEPNKPSDEASKTPKDDDKAGEEDTSKIDEEIKEALRNPGSGGQKFHASLSVNGVTREFDDPIEYQKALAELQGVMIPGLPGATPPTPQSDEAAKEAPAEPKVKTAPKNANTKKRKGSNQAAPRQNNARGNNNNNNNAQGRNPGMNPNLPPGNGFQFFFEVGPDGVVQQQGGEIPPNFMNRFPMPPMFPGFPPMGGMPGMPGMNRQMKDDPEALGGSDGFDNAVGPKTDAGKDKSPKDKEKKATGKESSKSSKTPSKSDRTKNSAAKADADKGDAAKSDDKP